MVKRLRRLLKYDLMNFISHGGKRHLKKDDACGKRRRVIVEYNSELA
jgi:hypothetical protein